MNVHDRGVRGDYRRRAQGSGKMARIYRLFYSDEDLEAPEDRKAADRQTASLAGMAITLLIVVVSLFLLRELHNKAAIEDCLLAGRSNCDAVVASLYATAHQR
jgi:hypothetical protein